MDDKTSEENEGAAGKGHCPLIVWIWGTVLALPKDELKGRSKGRIGKGRIKKVWIKNDELEKDRKKGRIKRTD